MSIAKSLLYISYILISFLLLINLIECKTDYIVEHSLNGLDWKTRGRLLIDYTARSGSISIHDWTDDEIDEWNELSKESKSFYKLRIKISENKNLISSVLTCQLNRGDERIVLHSDSDYNLVGFDYYTTNPSCYDVSSNVRSKKRKKITSNSIPKSLQKGVEVSMSFGDKGDSPFMAEYEIQPPKKETTSFWSKYWWIILIVGFVVLQSVASGAAG
eukprot:541124_1